MKPRSTPGAPSSLQGLRVVDFTTMIAGPYCTRCLSDSGAEVIKVEEPGGDFMRNFAPLREGQSAYFGNFNGGKKSVELDLKSAQGLRNARTLIDSADVVVENYRPGVMKRLGLDYETLARSNPRLVYCAISGYGQDGPGADSPAYAHVIHARSGFDHAWMGYQDPPRKPANSAIFFADVLAGIYGFSAILTALYQRTQTGQGQFIDVALLECMLGMLPYEVQEAQFPARTPRPVYPPVRTSDGFLMLAPVSPRTVEAMLTAVDLAGWREDSRFATAPARMVHWAEMMALVQEWTATRTTAECEAVFTRHGVPVSQYKSVAEALKDDVLIHRRTLQAVEDAAGAFLVPNLPYVMSGAAVQVGAAVPALGQHNREFFPDQKGPESK